MKTKQKTACFNASITTINGYDEGTLAKAYKLKPTGKEFKNMTVEEGIVLLRVHMITL